jgi:TRAP-type uncharacterized transport system substrate-binding protein
MKFLVLVLSLTGVGAAYAQDKLSTPQGSRSGVAQGAVAEQVVRTRKNANTVGLASGQLEGLYPRFAAEIQKVLDDGDNLRVLPFLAYGAASNVEDLLYLRGVDVAFTQSDVLEYYKTKLGVPNMENRLSYLLRLYNTELHILARPEIKSIEDLRGKKVSFGPAGNSAAMTGPIVLNRLNVPVEQLLLDHSEGLEQLKRGEISALVRVVGKPLDYFSKIPEGSGLHFLNVPSKNILDDIYALGELDAKDYPTLIKQGETVETISVPTVLAVYNWKPGTDRYQRLAKFSNALFDKWEKFQSGTFHPKWRDINIASEVPGWKRSTLAEQWLQAHQTGRSDERDFSAFLDETSRRAPMNETEKQRLFQEFADWRARKDVSRRRK